MGIGIWIMIIIWAIALGIAVLLDKNKRRWNYKTYIPILVAILVTVFLWFWPRAEEKMIEPKTYKEIKQFLTTVDSKVDPNYNIRIFMIFIALLSVVISMILIVYSDIIEPNYGRKLYQPNMDAAQHINNRLPKLKANQVLSRPSPEMYLLKTLIKLIPK
ncbi:hypothetical protein SNEBB_005816 [Seison nebaliae]|nr:hypothetical protein SNEBB_005816 [Seison nebaliae]